MEYILETDRLGLRHVTVDDAAFMLALLNDPGFLENIGDKEVRTLDAAREHISNGPIKSYQENGYGMYLVVRKEDGAEMGLAGLVNREGLDGVDLGYAFLPDYTGKGYALEAAESVVEDARGRLQLDELLAIVTLENGPSNRLLEKLGFQFDRMITLPRDDLEIRLLILPLKSQ